MPNKKLSTESVSDQARAWFSRLQADDVSDAERLQFKAWYQENPQHAEAYDKVQLFWQMLEIPAGQVQAKLAAQSDSRIVAKKSPVQRLTPYLAMTLVIILLFSPLAKQFQNWQSDYHTLAGEQLTVQLNDGSQVILNTDTALKVAYKESERRIQLLHGEAYFKVAHNKNRPFIVSNGSTSTQAVGTAFTVKESDDDTQVRVSEGTVKVSVDNSDTSALVHINQQIDYQHGQLTAVSATNIFETQAWQRGQLIFKQQSLEHVIAEINRYRSGKILLVNPRLKERVFSGVFNTADPNAAIDALKATLKLSSVDISEKLVLLY